MKALAAIANELDELLRPLGFERKKLTWNRPSGLFVDVVELQASKSRDSVTVNLGVVDLEAHSLIWGKKRPLIFEAPECTVQARIGELISGLDQWWSLAKRESVLQMRAAVGTYVLPFLERMHERAAMERWLTDAGVEGKRYPPPMLFLAFLRSGLGKETEACAVLSRLRRQTVGAWLARVDEVSKRLGCAAHEDK